MVRLADAPRIETHLVASTRSAGRRRRDRHAAAGAGAGQRAVRADRQAPARAAADGLTAAAALRPNRPSAFRARGAHGAPGCGAASARRSAWSGSRSCRRRAPGRARRPAPPRSGRRSAARSRIAASCAARRAASWPLITGICTSISTSVERPAVGGRRAAPPRSPSRPSRACGDVDAPLRERRHGDHHVDRVVLDQQDARLAQPLVLARLARQRRRRAAPPAAAAARPRRCCRAPGVAVDADLAAHQPGQLAADRQAQPGAAEARASSTRRPARTAGTGAAAARASTPLPLSTTARRTPPALPRGGQRCGRRPRP